MMKDFFTLTKAGIILFVLLSATIGYVVSFPVGQPLEFEQLLLMLVSLYFLSAGSFAINQAQEWRIDLKMPRTVDRPVPRGFLSPWQAYAIGGVMAVAGLLGLALIGEVVFYVGLASVLLYNGPYTLIWKRYWAFGAVPGAIPGALPVVIGYAVNKPDIFVPECLYLFTVMFLWQMPHFWCLAIRFKDDYKKGGIPVLPARVGDVRTLYHIGIYLFAYVGVALASPWFMKANFFYILLAVPFCVKLVWEFMQFFKASGKQRWLPFFMWTNFSVLVFLMAPAADKWIYYYLTR